MWKSLIIKSLHPVAHASKHSSITVRRSKSLFFYLTLLLCSFREGGKIMYALVTLHVSSFHTRQATESAAAAQTESSGQKLFRWLFHFIPVFKWKMSKKLHSTSLNRHNKPVCYLSKIRVIYSLFNELNTKELIVLWARALKCLKCFKSAKTCHQLLGTFSDLAPVA